MGFKRKRTSSSSSPLSITSSSAFASTPSSLPPTPFLPHDSAMDLDNTSTAPPRYNFDFGKRSWGLPVTRGLEATDLGSRTRKRFRDNRPDERTIHEKTMTLLFSAQRAQPLPSIATPCPEPTALPPKAQKSTLHAFWNLPAPPVIIQPPTPTPASFSQPPAVGTRPHCEDCDAHLGIEAGGMDVDMDMEMSGAEVGGGNLWACNECGRNVCGTCAVVSRTRHCLQCATKGRNSRRWW